MSFDSKDEIMLYNFATDMNIPITLHPECNFKYFYNNKVHTYEPDFITIISDCAEYLNYVKEKYGKLFLYSCKCK